MTKRKKNKLKREVHNFIINWNQKWPIDFWWRKKYNVSFGSEEHRQANFIQMYYEWYEAEAMKQWYSDDEGDESQDSDIPKDAEVSSVNKKISQKEIDLDFDSIDLSRYNTNKEELKKDSDG